MIQALAEILRKYSKFSSLHDILFPLLVTSNNIMNERCLAIFLTCYLSLTI